MGVVTRRNSFVVAAIALAASVTSLGNGFAYDDIPIIASNARVHDLSSWWTRFGSSYWSPQYGESLYRPLSMLDMRCNGRRETATRCSFTRSA